MVRYTLAALALAALGACDSGVTSKQALFSPGPDTPRPGLWAVLEKDDCPTPRDAAVQTWAGCAMPLWVSAGQVTYLGVSPLRSALVLAEGRPAIAQLEGKEGWSPPFFESAKSDGGSLAAGERHFGYLGVQPEGSSPFAKARLWVLPCPQEDAAGFGSLESNQNCTALTAEAVRRVAAAAVTGSKGYAAVWVAP